MIERLSAQTAEERERVGGKACGLIRLMKAGFTVPEAWVLSADRLSGECIPPDVESDLHHLWEDLHGTNPDLRLAVRSSASAEDLENASFAGVYETVLDICDSAGLVEAVGQCLAAMNSERARTYRHQAGTGNTARAALLIQRMLSPEKAGVLLTQNPQRPFAREIAMDAAWGLGEGVVSGRIQPDHLVIDRDTGKIRELSVGSKEIEIVYVPGAGHRERNVEPDRRSRPCLSERETAELANIARRVERMLGPRQDLEWAIEGDAVYLLQQRPITGLPPARPKVVWTRKFGDEYLADYTMPLSHELLTRWISEDFLLDLARRSGNRAVEGMEPIRRYHGYAYMNGDFVAKMSRGLPRFMRDFDRLSWFTPLWNEKILAEPFEPARLTGMLWALRSDPRSALSRNPACLERHCENIRKAVVPLLNQDYTSLPQRQWREQYDAVDEFGREHFRVIRWGMGFYNPILHGVLQRLLCAWAGDESGEIYQTVISGLPGTCTAEINRDIWLLANEARPGSGLGDAILAGTVYSDLSRRFATEPFWLSFNRFQQRHGHRSGSREIATPRWKETPDILIGFVRAQLRAPCSADPAEAEKNSEARRLQTERKILETLGFGPVAAARRLLLRRILYWTQVYTRYRENQRYYLDYLLLHIRQLVLEQGRRLAEKGVLQEPSDVFLLAAEDFWNLIANGQAGQQVRSRIEENRLDYLKWKDRLPATFLFDDVETEGEIAEGDQPPGPADPQTASGLAASRGVARGPVRLVRSLADLHSVHAGEVLVASNTDPGWTSVFPLLSALVTETGGLLSHGALLAREYGIPAVTGVRNATRLYATGDRIEVDGSRGIVRKIADIDRET